jgi:NAD+ diphosphatase
VQPPLAPDVLADPSTVVVVTRMSDGHVLVVDGGWPPGLGPGDEPIITAAGIVAVLLDDEAAASLEDAATVRFSDARTALLSRDDGPTAAGQTARDLLGAVAFGQWRHRVRFCPRCGTALHAAPGGRSLHCTRGHQELPRLEPAVIMRVVDRDDRILLARQPGWPAGRLSVLAGFVDPGESLEDTVRREVMEEVGVRVGRVGYVKSQPWPFPASLMLAFSATAETTDLRLLDGEIAEADWFTRTQLRDALSRGDRTLPTGLSVAHQLITAWLETTDRPRR